MKSFTVKQLDEDREMGAPLEIPFGVDARPGFVGKIQAGAAHVVERVVAIVKEFHVDIIEVFSCIIAISWFVPLTLYTGFMLKSTFMRNMLTYASQEVCQSIAGTIIIVHLFSLLVIGNPARLSRKRSVIQFWFRLRQIVMFCMAYVWWAIGIVISAGYITQGFILYSFMGVCCMYSSWLFNMYVVSEYAADHKIQVQDEAHRLFKQYMAQVEEPRRVNNPDG